MLLCMDGWRDGCTCALAVCASLSVYFYLSTNVCMHACMHACMRACMYVCMYVRMYVCVYVCINYMSMNEYSEAATWPLWF